MSDDTTWRKSGRVRSPTEAFGLLKEVSDTLMVACQSTIDSKIHVEIEVTITPLDTEKK